MTAADLVPILVVDDNAAKRLALRSVLTPLGYHIVEADSGVAALRCITEQDFAVILLDVRMPVMDGFETAALIRMREQSEHTPIIFVTAYAADEINTDRYAGGAVDFLFAPVPPHELRSKVSVFAKLYAKAAELAARAATVQASVEEFKLLALTDSLTGLDNRRAAVDRLEQALARARRLGHQVAVIFIDVDRFKAVNDNHGHAAGDAVLAMVADRLRSGFRTEDTIARLGGDEFVVICEDLAALDAVDIVVARTRRALAEPYAVAGKHLRLTASVGAACSDGHTTVERLLNHADAEMYDAKATREIFAALTGATD